MTNSKTPPSVHSQRGALPEFTKLSDLLLCSISLTETTFAARQLILQLVVHIGSLSKIAFSSVPSLVPPPEDFRETIVNVLSTCVAIGKIISPASNLTAFCLRKIELNSKKYPAQLCKGRSESYRAYSDVTGIGATGRLDNSSGLHDSTGSQDDAKLNSPEREEIEIVELQDTITKFVEERNWGVFHTWRNVTLALVGEVGELCEIFQWKGDVDVAESPSPNARASSTLTDDEITHVEQELADVTIYTLRLASLTKCPIN